MPPSASGEPVIATCEASGENMAVPINPSSATMVSRLMSSRFSMAMVDTVVGRFSSRLRDRRTSSSRESPLMSSSWAAVCPKVSGRIIPVARS